MKTVSLFLLACFLFCTPVIVYAQENKSQLSTHMLDINRGEPAGDVPVVLFMWEEDSYNWVVVYKGETAVNGRIDNLLPNGRDNQGTYKLLFETQSYFSKQRITSIYPYVEIIFTIDDDSHYHIPITMSANGYSTYRGS